MTAFSKRLSYRLARNTVLLAMLLGTLLNLVQVTEDFFSARQAMDNEIQALMEISHSPASQIAYNIDARLAEELLEGLLRHPAIVEAKITDPDALALAAKQRRSTDAAYRWLSDMLFGPSQSYSVNLEVRQLRGIPLGQLAITIDTYHYGNNFLRRATNTLITGFIKSLVLSIILLIVFYVVLTKPLLKLINALHQVDAGAPEKTRLPTPHGHEHDEIGLMVRIINSHLDTIDTNLDRIRVAEAKLKDHSTQLEQEVEARTREISEKNKALQRGNRALIKSKEDAVRRARSRATFLANMSHEIRTPLNGLLGMLSLTLESELSPTQRNRLEIARNAGQNLLSLLNDILDISKVEAGKLSLESIAFSMRELIEDAASLLANQAHSKAVELVTDIDPGLPELFRGDPTRINQIINNLLGNAIKFTEKGEVRLYATYTNDYLVLEVIDTGIGMSADAMEHIFAPFSQADTATTRHYGGTGLGLTLCRQLVERMHGQIDVESQPGKGTRFIVRLPLQLMNADTPPSDARLQQPELQSKGVWLLLPHANPHRLPLERQLKHWKIPVYGYDDAKSAAQAPPVLLIDSKVSHGKLPEDYPPASTILLGDEPANAEQSGFLNLCFPLRRRELHKVLLNALYPEGAPINVGAAGPERTLTDLRILLVEDNRVNQIVASTMLKKLGHQVDIAENGERAVAAVTSQPYDIVLMDCQMPVMDGFEATRRIRAHDTLRNLPIIAVTANVLEGDRDECITAGMNDYITKPFNQEGLKQVIQRWGNPTPTA
ncbi:MAG: response regulator [Marinobacter sp.]|nr:response regulator [Marinobacter sp.]